jgi:hypothetical protein
MSGVVSRTPGNELANTCCTMTCMHVCVVASLSIDCADSRILQGPELTLDVEGSGWPGWLQYAKFSFVQPHVRAKHNFRGISDRRGDAATDKLKGGIVSCYSHTCSSSCQARSTRRKSSRHTIPYCACRGLESASPGFENINVPATIVLFEFSYSFLLLPLLPSYYWYCGHCHTLPRHSYQGTTHCRFLGCLICEAFMMRLQRSPRAAHMLWLNLTSNAMCRSGTFTLILFAMWRKAMLRLYTPTAVRCLDLCSENTGQMRKLRSTGGLLVYDRP